jgi:hypothetical protein
MTIWVHPFAAPLARRRLRGVKVDLHAAAVLEASVLSALSREPALAARFLGRARSGATFAPEHVARVGRCVLTVVGCLPDPVAVERAAGELRRALAEAGFGVSDAPALQLAFLTVMRDAAGPVWTERTASDWRTALDLLRVLMTQPGQQGPVTAPSPERPASPRA